MKPDSLIKPEILPATPAHYPGIAALINAIYPEMHRTVEELTDDDLQRDPRFKYRRWIAIQQEQVVGTGAYNQSIWFDHPQKFLIGLSVLPSQQGHGIGSALYETILQALQPLDPIALRASATSDRPGSTRFLEKRGFREVIRDVPAFLDVQSFDPTRFSGLEQRFRDSGIQIKTLPELATDPGRDQKLYDLDWEISMSVPGDLAAGMGRRGLEKYVEFAISGPNAIPEAFFVAVKGDEYIGLSHLQNMETGVSLYQYLTGVKPAYRRLGIGLAMKVRCINYARATGHATIKTENDARNLPMLAMNQELGYVRQPDLITFEKQWQS
jgi:mycothiol synthase